MLPLLFSFEAVVFRTRGLLYFNPGRQQTVRSTALLQVRIPTLRPKKATITFVVVAFLRLAGLLTYLGRRWKSIAALLGYLLLPSDRITWQSASFVPE